MSHPDPSTRSALHIASLTARPFELPLRPPVRTGRTAMVRRAGLRLRLQTAGGPCGLGEATVWPGFMGSGGDVLPELAALQPVLEALARACPPLPVPAASPAGLTPPLRLALAQAWAPAADVAWSRVGGAAAWPGVAAAVQTALLDALGQQLDVPMAALLALQPAATVPVHAQVTSAYTAREAVAEGHRTLKIKVGAGSLDEELGRLCAIRIAVGHDVALRLDANGAWPARVARQALRMFASVSPAWVEQPIAADAPDALQTLRALRAEGVPIALDESIVDAAALGAALDAGVADAVVLKPAFVGGPLAAVALAQRAQARGVPVCITHALDGTVGRSAALQVALAVAGGVACGLGGALVGDLLPAPASSHGALAAPAGAGLGISDAARAQA